MRTHHARLSLLLLIIAGCGDDGRPTDTGGGDAAADSTATPSDAGGATVTAEAVCTALRRCIPDLEMTACVAGVQPGIARADGFGCLAEADAANQCSIDAYEAAADAGTCDSPTLAGCTAVYESFTDCMRAAGATVDFACDDSVDGTIPQCIEYTQNANDAEVLCGALGAEVVETCPPGTIVGQCEQNFAGTGITTRYYEGVDMGVLDSLEMACIDSGGTWTTP